MVQVRQPQVTEELVRALAESQGLRITDDRLELVRREYERFVQLVEDIARMPLPPETEPHTPTDPRS